MSFGILKTLAMENVKPRSLHWKFSMQLFLDFLLNSKVYYATEAHWLPIFFFF